MKRIRTNRRRRMKLKNFIACVTALSVVMGSSYFAFATDGEDPTYCGYTKETHHINEDHKESCYTVSEAEEHSDKCYVVTCGEEAHDHDNDCYATEPSCGVSDEQLNHVCTEDGTGCQMVYACGGDHEHEESCVTGECTSEHHTGECTQVCTLICPEDHANGHITGANGCYERNCGKDAHEHTYDPEDGGCFTLRATVEAEAAKKAAEEAAKAAADEQPTVDPETVPVENPTPAGNPVEEPAPANEPAPASEDPAPASENPTGSGEGESDPAPVVHDGTYVCYVVDRDCGKEELPHYHVARCYLDAEAEAEVDALITKINALDGTDDNALEEVLVYVANELDAEGKQLAVLAAEKAEGTEYTYKEKLDALKLNMDIKHLPELEDALGADLLDAKTLNTQYGSMTDAQKALVDATKLTEKTPATTENEAPDTYAEVFEEVVEVEDALNDASDESALIKAWQNYMALPIEWRALVTVKESVINEVKEIKTLPVDTAVEVPNATVTLFNYNKLVVDENNDFLKKFHFIQPVTVGEGETFEAKKAEMEDNVKNTNIVNYHKYGENIAYQNETSIRMHVMSTPIKADDGYPNTMEGSLKAVFSDPYKEATMKDGGGLFQWDSNDKVYYYDSTMNAASYNSSKNEFNLYDIAVMPKEFLEEVTASTVMTCQGCFYPFNEITSTNITTDPYNAAIGSTGETYQDQKEEGATYHEYYNDKLYGLNDKIDLSFGMMVEFDFFMPEDGKVDGEEMIFDFSGDDDVIVYINDFPVMDLLGTHTQLHGSINFATGEVKDNPMYRPAGEVNESTNTESDGKKAGNQFTNQEPRTRNMKDIFTDDGQALLEEIGDTGKFRLKANETYTFKFFYLERGGQVSNCKIRFNMPTVPPNALMVEKDVEPTTLTAPFADKEEYSFRVMATNGDADDAVMISNETIDIYERDATGLPTKTTRQIRVDGSGIFKLKDGEIAMFPNMLETYNNKPEYYIQELIPVEKVGDYQVTCDGTVLPTPTDSEGNVVKDEDGNVYYTSGTKKVDGSSETVTFKNTLTPSGELSITKEVTDDYSIFAPDTFTFDVKLNGKKLADNVKYTVDGTEKTSTGGEIVLKAGQTAVITGIPYGTTYEVKEADTGKLNVTYSEVQTETVYEDDLTTDVVEESYTKTTVNPFKDGEELADKATGEFDAVGDKIAIKVTNQSKEYTVPFTITKDAEDVEAGTEYDFYFDIEATDANGKEFTDFTVEEVTKTVDDEGNVTEYKKEEVDDNRAKIVVSREAATCTMQNPASGCTPEEVHEADCATKAEPVTPVCDCGVAEGVEHLATCAVNVPPVAPVCDCAVEIIHDDTCASLPQNEAAEKELVLVFNENTEPGTYTFKVTEAVPADNHTDKYVYDDTEYLVTIEVGQPTAEKRAVVKSVTMDGIADTRFNVEDQIIPALQFENTLRPNTPPGGGGGDDDDKDVTVTKVWSGIPEEDWTDIEVQLVDQTGAVYGTKVLNKTNNWTATWYDLDEDLKYQAKELNVPEGMTVSYGGSATNQTITNTLDDDDSKKDPEDPKDPPKDPSDPDDDGDVLGIDDENVPKGDMVLADEEEVLAAETGDSNHALAALAAMIAALAGIVLLKKRKAN